MNKAAGDLQSAPAQPLRGIIFVLAAVFVFASMDTINKHLAINYPVPLIMAVRYLINLVGVILIFAPRHGRALLQMKRRQLVLFRGASLAASSLLMGFALQLMPVAETVAIIYLAPFGVLLLSGPLLKEPVKLAGWIATATGFVGLLFIVRPGSCLDPTGVMFAICAIVGTISYHMLSRLLAKTESTMALLFYTALIGTVIFCALLPWNIRGPTPTPLDVALFIAIGVLS